MTKKLILCLVAFALVFCSACTINMDTEGDNKSDIGKNETGYEAGTLFTYECVTKDGHTPTDEEIAAVLSFLRLRLDSLGKNEAVANAIKNGNEILIEVWTPEFLGYSERNQLSAQLVAHSELTFSDEDGNELLNSSHIKKAEANCDGYDNPHICIIFTEEGKVIFEKATTQNIGRKISINVGGVPISAPTVNAPITDGECYIEGAFTEEEAQTFADQINSSLLPVALNLLSIDVISK